ncbi:MAG: carboxymuconolactone decarboxylase family protein [Ezakiella sp.]|nr:carboxymuconolactone decarboxylase family protein [Ezakiella sp.]MDY3946495.1 carboxymuconolactone decarboxylase family protein [Ezakiella sp.]
MIYQELNPNVANAFGEACAIAISEGKLTLKQKELIALAIGVAVRCEPCINHHAPAAVKAGCNLDELSEMVGINIMMGGGPGSAYGEKALMVAKEAGAKEAENKKTIERITETPSIEGNTPLERLNPDYAKKFYLIGKNATQDGYLTYKEKELIALAIAIAVRCEGCIKHHTPLAIKAGASLEELGEMAAVCIAMGGGPSSQYANIALELAEKLTK